MKARKMEANNVEAIKKDISKAIDKLNAAQQKVDEANKMVKIAKYELTRAYIALEDSSNDN